MADNSKEISENLKRAINFISASFLRDTDGSANHTKQKITLDEHIKKATRLLYGSLRLFGIGIYTKEVFTQDQLINNGILFTSVNL